MKNYMIIYDDYNEERFYVCEAIGIHDLIIKFADYTGVKNNLFVKAISGLDYNALTDFVEMYNFFSDYTINKIFEINKTLYGGNKK